MTKWRFQHEDESQIVSDKCDIRGLELKKECGYRWVNRNDGNGWRPIDFVINEEEVRAIANGTYDRWEEREEEIENWHKNCGLRVC
jgi:hypothetical protein